MNSYFFPKLLSVSAIEPYRLRTIWSTGETLDVDIEAQLRSHPALTTILDPEVFVTVHLDEWSHSSIEWFDCEFGADNVYAWAKEQTHGVSHQMFDHWMQRNNLSLTNAAEMLGISRRMVSYYRTAHHDIPRSIWFACLGWEAAQSNIDTLKMPFPLHLPRNNHQSTSITA